MDSGRLWRASVMTAVVASASVYVPAAMAQSAPSNAELANLVKQQAAQIQRLNARIDQLEQQRSGQGASQTASSGMSANAANGGAPRQTQPSVPSGKAAEKATYASNGQSNASLEQRVSKLEKDSVKVDWSDGAPELSSPNGDYTFGIGGRIQYDFSGTTGSDYNSRNITGSEFRRIRLDAHGKVAGWLMYKSELDFAGNSVGIRDMYLAAQKNFELGKGVVYLGSKFSDSGLDGRTSSKYTWFTERNTVANAISLAPGAYNVGVSTAFYGKQDDHISFAVTNGSTNDSNKSSDNVLIRSRAHWDPINTGNTIVHLGANGYYEDYSSGHSGFSDRTIIADHYNGNLRVEGPELNADSSTSYGFELAGLTGPFAAGAEYGRLDVNARNGGTDTHIDAYSAQVGVSLTGEKFGYSTKQGVWTHPDVAHPVTQGGIGAWQLMARYQAVNAHHSAIYGGGTGHGTTVGLSWYLNDYMRVLLDDTLWQTDNRSGSYTGVDNGNTVSARTQIVF
ncbi:porin [Salinisphaera hydrothermalis]|uniref:porin n=1 Tax=Salinisphaera hydrothermalis TaxID=563188 RepID=UPI0033408AF5